MNESRKILVISSSLAGSTTEVAQALADELKSQGAIVDVYSTKNAPSPAGYDAVVIGSAIRYGMWQSEVIAYVKTNKKLLSTMPVAYFNVGISLGHGTEKQKEEVNKYNDAAKAVVKPVADVAFAGKIDYSKLGFFAKILSKLIGIPEGDKRDFDIIRAWARTIFPLLTQRSS